MTVTTPEKGGSSRMKKQRANFIVSFMALCTRHAKQIKLTAKNLRRTHFDVHLKTPRLKNSGEKNGGDTGGGERKDMCITPSEKTRTNGLFACIRNRTMTMDRRGKPQLGGGKAAMAEEEEAYGVWQREIMMGDKCEPLDFSGVIYYDSNGRQIEERPPRTPRGIPLKPTVTV